MWQKERAHLTLSSEPLFYIILILSASLYYPFLFSPLLLSALFAQQCRVSVDGMFYLADTNKLVGGV